MDDKLRIQLTSPQLLHVHTQGGSAGITDYNRLKNKPCINGVELAGYLTSEGLHIVSEDTVEGWAEHPTYVPRNGEIVLYTNYAEDEHGNPIPAIKVGDGNAFIADLPFVGDDIRSNLLEHINDRVAHVTDEEREFWNNKLNYDYNIGDETLILNRN